MANNINRLGFNITGYNYVRQEETAANSAPKQREAEKENKQIAANDVLGFMAATNADMIPVKVQRTVDVNKYVTAEQAQRIESFVKGFESDYNELTAAAVNELGVSEKAAGEIALKYIENSY